MISLSGLNEFQREAASTIRGPVLILAGAGSGKTRTLTYRIAHMVDNLGISPKNILAVSFTNKAAKEMRERVMTLLSKRKSRGITLATFHSLGVKLLKQEIDKLGYHKNFSIYDTSDQNAIIREALKHFSSEKAKFDHKQILSKIGYLKNVGITEDDFADSPYFDDENPYDHATEFCFRYYQDKLKFYNAIDFDDILHLTVKLFKENPDIAEKYSQQFQYIMVDEYQDTNALQFDLILQLTKCHNNLCVVGDDDQSIYAFRGADVTNILNFEKNYPAAKVIKLEENYRSISPILNLANRIIKENKNRREKTLWSQKPSDFKPILWSTADTDHEAQIIVDEIVKHQSEGKHLGDIAILYRSKTQAPPIEDQLRLSDVPYTIIGGQKLYEKKEVKDLIAYLTVIVNRNDELALRRILNVPNRGIGTVTLNTFIEISKERKITLFEAMDLFPDAAGKRADKIRSFIDLIHKYAEKFETYPLSESTSTLIEDIDYLKFIDKQYDDNAKQADRRKRDIMFFIESAERFTNYNGEDSSLKDFVERLLLQDSQDKEDEDEDDDVRKNEITMMTLHSSKGLEFPYVFLAGMEEESLPHKRTIAEGGDISEERRLCYVGITRAQEKIVMTYCKQRKIYGKETPRHKSRFVLDLEKEGFLVEQDRTTFGHLTKDEEKEYKKNFFAGLIDGLD